MTQYRQSVWSLFESVRASSQARHLRCIRNLTSQIGLSGRITPGKDTAVVQLGTDQTRGTKAGTSSTMTQREARQTTPSRVDPLTMQ